MKTLLNLPCIDRLALEGLSRSLAGLARPGDVLLLIGDLGSGKTTFARAFIQSLGVSEDVPSPTFTLLQTYDTDDLTLYHFDLYRLEEPEEVYELGLEDALEDGVSLIEWPEIAMDMLPDDRLEIRFSAGDAPDNRNVELRGGASWQERLKKDGDGQ